MRENLALQSELRLSKRGKSKLKNTLRNRVDYCGESCDSELLIASASFCVKILRKPERISRSRS